MSPQRDIILQNAPAEFLVKYPNNTVIIDATCCVSGFVMYYYRVKRAQTKCSTQLLYLLITHNDV